MAEHWLYAMADEFVYSSHSGFPRTAAARAMRTDVIYTCFHYAPAAGTGGRNRTKQNRTAAPTRLRTACCHVPLFSLCVFAMPGRVAAAPAQLT